MKNIRKYIAFISSLIIASTAAFFSITGISKLFSGAAVAAIVMASALEIGKLVTASLLQKHWSELKWTVRTYLFIATFILMVITGAGIYGFLVDSYQKTANQFEAIEKRIEIIEKKESLIKKEIERYESSINLKNERINSLTNLRSKQEDRVDNLINSNKNSSAKAAQKSISEGSAEIKSISQEIAELNAKINVLNDSIGSFENQKLELSNSDVAAEIGPLKYIANLTGQPMDKVVNWFILMLVIVFDPLAIALLIASQSIGNDNKKEENKNVLGDKLVDKLKQLENSLKNHANKSEPISSLAPTKVEEKEKDVKEEVEEDIENKEENSLENIEEKNQEPPSESNQNNFEKYYEAQINNMNKYKTKFEELLSILYDGGRVKAGENLLNFIDFKNKLDELFKNKFTNEEIKRFLSVCNYLKITSLNDGERKALVDFDVAKKTLEVFHSNK
jgi:prefoldin subunit 5